MLSPTVSNVSILLLLLLLFIMTSTTTSFKFDFDHSCRGGRPGDCDPEACGGPCEARYIRYFDRSIQGDRTAKSCQCIEEKICSIVGMHSNTGCRSYATLSTAGQRIVRIWSMDSRDRKNRHSNDVLKRFSDKLRHHQLMNGNSRFCCRSRGPSKSRTMELKTARQSAGTMTAMVVGVMALMR